MVSYKKSVKNLVYSLAILLLLILLAACDNNSASVTVNKTAMATTTIATRTTAPTFPPTLTPQPTFSPTAILSTQSPNIENPSTRWLKGVPCSAPCWEGITPGKTTASEALEILKKDVSLSVVQTGASELFSDDGTIEWKWANSNDGGSVSYHAQSPTQIIEGIRLVFSTPIRLGDVVKAYGQPTHIIARVYQVNEGTTWNSYSIEVFYQSFGFSLITDSKTKPVLNLDTSFISVSQYNPAPNWILESLKDDAKYLVS